MIHYQLRCSHRHEFDGWFKDSLGFEKQADRGLVACPECGDTDVTRALMAPALPRKGERIVPPQLPAEAPAPVAPVKAAAGPVPAQMIAMLQRMRAEVERNCDYVGEQFAAEARKIHRGKSDKRSIYGESTPEQAEALAEEGIDVSQIPWVPRADG